jgi:hypothetical protein
VDVFDQLLSVVTDTSCVKSAWNSAGVVPVLLSKIVEASIVGDEVTDRIVALWTDSSVWTWGQP